MSVMTDDYFAGLFDGEGTIRISFNGRQYQLLASLGMTDERPVRALRERFGGWVEYRSNEGTEWQPVWIWRSSSIEPLLDALDGVLVVKARQAGLAREFLAVLAAGRAPQPDPAKAAIYTKMKEANRRGRHTD